MELDFSSVEDLWGLVAGGALWAACDRLIKVVKSWKESKAEGDLNDAAIRLADSARAGTDHQTSFSNRLLIVIENMPKEMGKVVDKQAESFRAILTDQEHRCDARTKSTQEFIENRFQGEVRKVHQKMDDLFYALTNARVTIPTPSNSNPFQPAISNNYDLSSKVP